MIKTALFAAAAAIAAVATASPVLAKDISVSYKDLDLSSAEGQAKLAQRLDTAAKDACGLTASRTGTRLPSRSATECYKQAQSRSKDTLAAIIDGARLGG